MSNVVSRGYLSDEWRFSYQIGKNGEGKYYATVAVLSSDIDTIAHGAEGEPSGIYDTTIYDTTEKEISDAYEEAKGDAATAAALLAGTEESSEKIAAAMQIDTEVLEKIKGLEELYTEEKDVTIEAVSVSEEAGKLVDTFKVSIVGAALNDNDGSSIGL